MYLPTPWRIAMVMAVTLRVGAEGKGAKRKERSPSLWRRCRSMSDLHSLRNSRTPASSSFLQNVTTHFVAQFGMLLASFSFFFFYNNLLCTSMYCV
jgi:hypothetical protein